MRFAASLLLAAVSLATVAPAGAGEALSVERLWEVKRVGQPVLAPDGRRVAFTVTAYDVQENRGNADIWLSSLDGGAPRRLTSHKASESAPVWSPDGRRLAYVSKREGDDAGQLYLLPLDGGEPERLTEMPLGVQSPKWLPDGSGIVFVSHVIEGAWSPAETKQALAERDKAKLKARVTENRLYRHWDRWLTDGEYPHLFVLDLARREVRDLLPGSRRYFGLEDGDGDYDVSPDGTTIVFAANSTEPPYRTLNWDLFAVGTSGGEVRNLTAANPAQDAGPVFSPDGTRIAYGMERKADGWPDYTRLAVMDLASGRTSVLTEGWENAASGWTWADDARLVFHAEVRTRVNLYSIAAAGGAPPTLVHRGGTTAGAEVAAAGEIVFQQHDLSRPPELAVVRLDGSGFRWLTSVNDALVAGLALGRVEELVFEGAGKAEVQMFVVYPPGFDAARRYPLVQLVHGGPVGTFGDGFHFRWNAQAFAAPGYVVAMVNFHGSSSFGQAWVESILGAHPERPFTDVMKATDFLIARGSVDPERLAAAGGSYGGFLVNWIAGHTPRFKALVSHAGVYSLLGQSASDATYGRHHSYGGHPFTNLANIEKWSPNRFAAGFATPMLILHSERDYRVPVTQGLELYGVLTAKGVPARLVYYPDENHWVLKPQNARHWWGEVLGWLGRYLGS